MKKANLLAISVCIAASAFAEKAEPYTGSRIFWDLSTRKTVFESGIYSRIIELQDGRLLAVAEGGGVNISFSSNAGSKWSYPSRIIANPEKVNYAVPDLIQLSDGTIIIGYNPRPSEPYSSDRKFGIRALRSTDNGKTWSEPIFVFDASYKGDDGCWEPSFLELPSGEVQCYFADESSYTNSSEQCISMCRSFDKGLTWSKPVKVSFRAGKRDGMPVPVLLKDSNEIAVIIEDNGFQDRTQFTATTVRCPLSDNWESGYVNANSPNRNIIFETTPKIGIESAAPYLRVLPNGETVASFQGNEGRYSTNLQFYDMFVLVGDKDAKNFKAQSTPFAMPSTQHSIWNSLSVLSDGTVIAVGSIGSINGGSSIEMIKGYPINKVKANYDGNIVVDGEKSSSETWTAKYAAQLFMGYLTKNRATMDFAYDDKYLYFTARVTDGNIINNGYDNDGVRLFIDADDVCGTTLEKGMYRIFFDSNGSAEFYGGNNGSWEKVDDTSGLKYAITTKTSYYNIEAAIPWEMLGKSSAPLNQRMAVALELVDKEETTLKTETIPDVDNKKSSTWMEFRLQDNGSVEEITNEAKKATVVADSGFISIKSSESIKDAMLFAFDGKLLSSTQVSGNSTSIPQPNHNGGGIMKIRFSDGSEESHKVIFK